MRVIGVVTSLAIAITAIISPAAAERTPAASSLDLSYTIAFWGISIGHTEYQANFGSGTYQAKAHFETGAVIGILWKSTVDAVANGAIGRGFVSPAIYDSRSENHDKPMQDVKLSFSNGAPTVVANPPYQGNRYPVSDEQRKGTIDPMSALTSMFSSAIADGKHPCGNAFMFSMDGGVTMFSLSM